MRTYGQYCGLARALDVVGDRWTLLIVRELMLLGSARYTDLRNGLPGIATNLLAERLAELEEAGVIEREEAPPPIATTLYRLTPRGEQLEPALRALGAWGTPLLGPWKPGQAFHSYWLAFPLERGLRDRSPASPPIAVELRTGEEPVTLRTRDGGVRVSPGAGASPDAVLSGPPDLILGLLFGKLSLRGARNRGLGIEGRVDAIRRVMVRSRTGRDPVTPRRTAL